MMNRPLRLIRILGLYTLLLLGTDYVFAMAGATADCDGDGVQDVTCSGATCTSQDGPGGGCACFTDEGGADIKVCGSGLQDAEEGASLQARWVWTEPTPGCGARPVPELPGGSREPAEAARV